MQFKTIAALVVVGAIHAPNAWAVDVTIHEGPYFRQGSPGDKAERADLIVVAKVARLKYFKWPNPKGFFFSMPSTSDTPINDYTEYIYLANVKVLWDKYADVPAEFNFLKKGRPLWSQSYGCIQNDSYQWPLASSMLGETRIFFLKPAISASENTQLVTVCISGSAPLADLPVIREILIKRKASIALTQRK
jgi:hypothetical protein